MSGVISFDDRTTAAVTELVDQWVRDHHLPGVVVSLFDRVGQLPTIASGALDLELEPDLDVARANEAIAPSRDSLFRIASMTKSFTSAAVLALRDDGVLGLDVPVAELATSLERVSGSTADAPAITLRMLLTMSAGFATDDPWADRLLDADRATMDDLFERGAHAAHPASTAFQYSNYGFAMVGRVIEEVTGEPVRDHVTKRFLQPLGMHDTVWDPPSGERVATGYRWVPSIDGTNDADGIWQRELAPLGDGGVAPMGGLWSTIDDLQRWVRFMLDAFPARNDADDEPLRRSSRRELQQIHRSLGMPGVASGYGMGVQVVHHATLGTVVAHSGGLPGFGSNMRWLVDHGIGIVALSNLTYAPMAALTTAIAERLPALGGVDRLPPPAVDSPAVAGAYDFLVAVLAPALAGEAPDWFADPKASGWAINFDLDESFDRRAAWLSKRLEPLLGHATSEGLCFGPLTIESGAAGRFTTEAVTHAASTSTSEASRLTIIFTLSAESPPRVQHLEFTLT